MGKGEYLTHMSWGRMYTLASRSTSLVRGLGSNTLVFSVYPQPVITASLGNTGTYQKFWDNGTLEHVVTRYKLIEQIFLICDSFLFPKVSSGSWGKHAGLIVPVNEQFSARPPQTYTAYLRIGPVQRGATRRDLRLRSSGHSLGNEWF